MYKLLLLFLAAICFVHIIRDYLQIKGIENWFTQFGHFWNAPQYNVPGMVIFAIVGLLSLYFGLRL